MSTTDIYDTTEGQTLDAHFDIEADGPSPWKNSANSFGICFMNSNGKIVAEFLGDMEPLPGKVEDPDTMKYFWDKDDNNRKELQRIREHAKPAMEVMTDLNDFIKSLKAKRISWKARPAAYDWQWLNYYQNAYLDYCSQKGVEAGSLSGNPKRQVFKADCASTMRDIYQVQYGLDREAMEVQCKEWVEESGFKMTHNPLDDARFQAVIYNKLFDALSKNKAKVE